MSQSYWQFQDILSQCIALQWLMILQSFILSSEITLAFICYLFLSAVLIFSLSLFSSRSVEDTFKNAQWRKVEQMQPMWLCIFPCRPFEETFENTQRWKVKQMQPMWLCIYSGRQFQDTFENAQWKQSNKCKQCDFASFLGGNLRTHLKTHSQINVTNVTAICIFSGRQFEETFENTQRREDKQMQSMWLCILWGIQFEKTFNYA